MSKNKNSMPVEPKRMEKKPVLSGMFYATRSRLIFLFALLTFTISISAAHAQLGLQQQPLALSCNDACQRAYNVEGVCLIPGQFTGGLTPYTAAQVCPVGQTCWCKTDPGTLCNERCVMEFKYQSGSCSPVATCTPAPNVPSPGYGHVATNFQVPRAQLSCGLDPTMVCCCRNIRSDIHSQVQNFVAAFVLISQKECAYQAADGMYSVRLAGVWGGGAGLRIDIPGAIPVFGQFPGTAPTAPGYPPAGLFSAGPFFQTFRVPQRVVEALPDRMLKARVTVLPTPGQALANFYRQSLAPNYPTDFGSAIGQNFFFEDVICEGPPLPTPLERLPPAEGPKEIKLLRAECGPKATVYQNEAHLIDFNRESWFQFAASPDSTQPGTGGRVEQFTLGGTGLPGSVPSGHMRPAGEPINVTIATPAKAASGRPAQGSCTFNFVGSQELYGAEITSWDNTDNITLKEVQVGPTKYPIGAKIEPNGTAVSFAEYNISTPIRSAAIRFVFEYTGAPALAELNVFPDVALVALNVSPARAIRGSEVTLLGTVTRREFSASNGRLLYCTYKWEGGCYPCVGRDCKPHPTNFLGKPNWAVFLPLPWIGSTIDTIKNISTNVTGFQFLPPVVELEVDVSVLPSEAQSAAAQKGIEAARLSNEKQNAEALQILLKRYGENSKRLDELKQKQIAQSQKNNELQQVQSEISSIEQELGTIKEGIEKTRTALQGTSISPYTTFRLRGTAKNLITMSMMTLVNTVANEENLKWYGVAGLNIAILGALPITAITSIFAEGGFFGGDISPRFPGCFAGGLLGCAVGDALNSLRCGGSERLPGPDGLLGTGDDRLGQTCKIFFTFLTWWDLDSRPEPDPDGDGDYAYMPGTENSCQKPTAMAEYLFNAGWWSLIQQLGDAVENLQEKAAEAAKAEAKREYEKAGTCELCVKGIVQGQALSTQAREDFITACENVFDTGEVSPAQKLCISKADVGEEAAKRDKTIIRKEIEKRITVSMKVVGVADSCAAPFDFVPNVLEKAQCRSAIEGTATRAPGKWCAKKITIEGNDFFTTERSLFAGSRREMTGVCVPMDEPCPSEDYKAVWEEVACKQLIPPANIANSLLDATFKNITSCSECTTKRLMIDGVERKGQWCLDLVSKPDTKLLDPINSKGECKTQCGTGFVPPPAPPGKLDIPSKYALTNPAYCAIDAAIANAAKESITRQIQSTIDDVNEQIYQTLADSNLITCERCNAERRTWCVSVAEDGEVTRHCTLDTTKCTGGAATTAPPASCAQLRNLETLLIRASNDARKLYAELNSLRGEVDSVVSLLRGFGVGASDQLLKELVSIRDEIGRMQAELLVAEAIPREKLNDITKKMESIKKKLEDLKTEWKKIIGSGTVTGIVMDEHDTPLSNVVVRASLDGTTKSASPTGNDGKYTLADLSPGTYTVSAGQGFTPQTVILERGRHETKTVNFKRGAPPAQPQTGTQAPGTQTAPAPTAPLTIATLPTGTVAVPYSQNLVTGGTPPYTLVSGAPFVLPLGLAIDLTKGVVSGKPRKSGSFDVKVSIRDSAGQTANAEYSMTIDPNTDYRTEIDCNTVLVTKFSPTSSVVGTRDCEIESDPERGSIELTTFIGHRVEIFGRKDRYGGICDILIDGAKVTEVDTYSADEQNGVLIYRSNDLTEGRHSIKIAATDRFNTASGDDECDVSYFAVYSHITELPFKPAGQFGPTIQAANLPPGTEVPEAPGTAQPFGIPATGQLISAKESLAGFSGGQYSNEQGELLANDYAFEDSQPSEPSYIPLGRVPSTGLFGSGSLPLSPGSGANPSDSSSLGLFGPIPATGMQFPIVSSQANALTMLQMMIAQAGGRLQQLSASIQIFESLKDGTSIYSRGFIVPPGLNPVCPALDPAFKGKTLLSRKFVQPKKDRDIFVSEAYPYWTSEGGISPINTTVYITIRNSSGAIVKGACRDLAGRTVDCNRVAVNSDYQGRTGVFRYVFVPPYEDRFDIRAFAAGSAGTAAGGSVIAGPKPPLDVQTTSPFLCGPPGEEKRFVVTLTEPESSTPPVIYRLSVTPSGGGTGFLVYDQQGKLVIAPALDLPMSSGTSTQVIINSKASSDTVLRLRIENSTYGELKQVNLTHKISFREKPQLIVKNPGSAQSTLAEVEYLLELKNNVPAGCDPAVWALEKEPPAPTGWNVFFNTTKADISTIIAPGQNATRFPLRATPLTLPNIGRYPIYVRAAEFAPMKFKDTGDAVAVAADAQNVYYVTGTGLLRIVDRLTGSTIERTAGQNPSGVALDADRVYFAAGGRIASTFKTGAFSPRDIAIGTFASQIAVDATDVYWIEGNMIKRTAKLPAAADCSGTKCAIILGVPALDITLDANWVYWTERDSVKRALKANPSVTQTVFTGKKDLNGLAAFGGSLYATYESKDTGKIVRLEANGTTEDVLGDANTEVRDFAYAIARNSPTDITVSSDGTALYWVEGRAVWTIPVDTLAALAIAYYQFSPFAPGVTIVPDKALASRGDLARFSVNITNRADIPVFYTLNLSPAPPPGWTAKLSPDSALISRSASASAAVEVQSPLTALPNASYAFCVRAQNGTGLFGISGQGCSSYFISPHERPGVTLALLPETPLPAGPGATVGWTAAVENRNPPEFISAAPINLSFVLPEGWKGFFLTPDNRQVRSLLIAIPSATTNSSIKFFATSSKSSPDGDYPVAVRASIEGLVGEGGATYSVKGCGNNICEPDRGETQRLPDGSPAPLWCEADCSLGFNNFRCMFFKNSSTLSWFECDNTRDNDVQFRSEISVPQAAQLSRTAAIACKRGSSPEACKAAADAGNCGLSVAGFAGALADCVASLQPVGTGVTGPRYDGLMSCPVDHEGEYYLLFTGTQTTLGPDLSPQFTQVNFLSSNFTFNCPVYRLQELADKQAQWQTILEGCPGRVQQLQGIGQRTCADVVRQTCVLRERLISEMNALLRSPNAARSESLIARIQSTEAFIASRLQVTCFGIPGLQITGVVPPGTHVGESRLIKVKVNNSFTEDYRGYASCEVELPGGLRRQLNGFCTVFKNLTGTEAPIPITLTDQGVWKINSCSVYADLAGTISEADCFNAPLFTSAPSDVRFEVLPAEAFLTRPFDGETVRGTHRTEAVISGTFEGYNFSYSLISPSCAGGPLIPLETPDTGFTRTYSGVWDTSGLPDKSHFACLMLTVAGRPFAADTASAIVDNFNFIVSESITTRDVKARESKTFSIGLTNTGRDDDYVITCDAPPGWSAAVSVAGQQAACGQLLSTSLGSGLKMPISIKTTVPDQQSGSALIKVTITNSQGETLETRHTLNIAGVANDPPILTSADISPVSISSGGAISFRAGLSDPDGDAVTSARVCADENCSIARCSMSFGAGQWSCTAQVTGDPGTYNWWVEAKDNLDKTAVLATGKPFQIAGVGPPLKCESPNACLPSCQPDLALCINRTDFGKRDCPLGRVCCRSEPIPACTPAMGCIVKIDSAKCVWDPVQKNYSVSAQVGWSGGAYVRVSVADQTSDRIFEKTATHAVKTTTPGAHVVAASVSAANDDVLCTNITQTTCVPPGSEPPGSGVTSPRVAIINAVASSFQPGKIAANTIDGDQFTPWQSRPGMPQWLRLELGTAKTVSGVGIYTVANRPTDFFIDTSTDCVRWTNVGRVRSATYAKDWNVTRFAQRDAKCILLNFTRSESDTVSIFEVEVYGGAVAIPVAPPPPAEFPLLPAAGAVAIAVAAGTAFIYRERLRLWWKYITAR